MSSPGHGIAFLRNALSNWAAFVVVALVGFFLSPFIVNKLGGASYGVWSLLVSLVGYLGLLDFGVRGAVTRFVARHHAERDDAKSSAIVSAAVVLFGGLGILAVFIAGGVAIAAPRLFNIPTELIGAARDALWIGGVTIAITLIGSVYAGVVTGLERFDVSSATEIAVTILRTVAIVLALDAGHGILALAWIHLLFAALHGAIAWCVVRRIYPALRVRIGRHIKPQFRTILSFSAFLSLIHVFGLVIYYSNALIIAAFLPIAAVTYFAIAGNLVDYAQKVAGALSKMMTPRVSAMMVGDEQDVSATVLGAACFATLATAPIALTFLFRGETFIARWMGQEFAPQAGLILQILAPTVLLGGARAIAASSIIGANQHRLLIPGLAIEAVLNLALCVQLVKSIGVAGVAYGSSIPSIMASLLFFPWCLSQACKVSARRFIEYGWLRPTLACVPFAFATYLTERWWPTAGLAVFFFQVAVSIPLVALPAWYLCLNGAQRAGAAGSMIGVIWKFVGKSPTRKH